IIFNDRAPVLLVYLQSESFLIHAFIMKHRSSYILISIFFIVFIHHASFAQNHPVDSNYIQAFDRKNIIEIYPGIYSTHFNFSNRRQRKNDYSLVANSNAHISTNINYKWLSLRYSWAMPGTQLDEKVKLKY